MDKWAEGDRLMKANTFSRVLVISVVIVAGYKRQGDQSADQPTTDTEVLELPNSVTLCIATKGVTKKVTVDAAAVDALIATGAFRPDCAGMCNGTATKDCAGVCNGTATVDCAGMCNGTATVDCAGVCNGPKRVDCFGNCGGTAVRDCFGTCGGTAVRDCSGLCGGAAVRDCSGTCRGMAVVDCMGVCGGHAFRCSSNNLCEYQPCANRPDHFRTRFLTCLRDCTVVDAACEQDCERWAGCSGPLEINSDGVTSIDFSICYP